MWWTSCGERALQGSEWALFREGLDLSWNEVEESMDHPDLWIFDVEAFDILQPSQKLALLAEVGTALKDESQPHPELTAHNEATIAAIFGMITTQVGVEIDMAADDEVPKELLATRKLVLDAYCEVFQDEAIETRKTTDEAIEAGSRPTPSAVDHADSDEDDEVWNPPAVDSTDLEEWKFLIDRMANRILWDDGDYEMEDDFIDDDPRLSRAKMQIMGIPDDYFTAIAPDPTDDELVEIRQQLAELCGRPGSHLAR
jgi:hypothetical protein